MSTTNTPVTQKPASIVNFLNTPSTANFLSDILKEKKSEFVSNLIALCDSDKNLASCDPSQLMKCAMNATSLNLPLNKNLGYAYVIAYKGIPSFQIGYKGLIQLAIRTGQYKSINATEIREGEIEINKISGGVVFNGEKPNNKLVGYLAFIEMVNGFTHSYYMTLDQLEEHALRFSQTYKNDKNYGKATSKWSDPLARPAMSKKTVLKMLLGTYGLMTTEFAKAFESESEEETTAGNRYEDAQVITQDEPVENQSSEIAGEQPTERIDI